MHGRHVSDSTLRQPPAPAAGASSRLTVGLTGHRLRLPAGHSFPRHAHGGWSIAVVQAGVGYIRCAGRLHEAPAGAITVLHPGETHDGWVHREDGLDYLVIQVSEQAVNAVYGGGGMPAFGERVFHDPGCAAATRSRWTRTNGGSSPTRRAASSPATTPFLQTPTR